MLLTNMSSVNSFCLVSYNSRGFCALKQEFCRILSSKEVVGNSLPVLCNQENFVLKSNTYKINNALPGFHIVLKPAVLSSCDRGRPKGGLFIALPVSLRNCLVDVSPTNWRLQAVLLNCESSRILLINSYFPVDTRLNNYDEAELIETLQCIQTIINNVQHDAIIWAGDINTDFDRNTKHVNIVRNCIEENHLITAWDRFDIDFTHYSELNGRSFVSTIDHFFWFRTLG